MQRRKMTILISLYLVVVARAKPLNSLIAELYVGCVKVIIQRIKADNRDINTALSAENIRVDRESVNETSVDYRVIFRGQVGNIEITKNQARTEIGELLSGYIRNVVSDLTKRLCYP
jgi:hypothetical protein